MALVKFIILRTDNMNRDLSGEINCADVAVAFNELVKGLFFELKEER